MTVTPLAKLAAKVRAMVGDGVLRGASDPQDVPYIEKVMTEKHRLQQVLRTKPPRGSRDVEASASLAGERFASAH